MDDAEILNLARSNYLAASMLEGEELPENSNRWTSIQERMRSAIMSFGTIDEVIQFGQTSFQFDHREPIAGNVHRFPIYLNSLRYEYPHFAHLLDQFEDSPRSVANTITLLQNTGKYVSNITFFHAFYVLSCLTHRQDIDSVLEVGGGYGGAARVWLTNPIRSISRYGIIDMPESLFFAECFLRATLKTHEVVYCLPGVEPDEAVANRIYLYPIANHEQTNDVSWSVITNTGSLAELSIDWVLWWREWLGKQRYKLFYSHNYFGLPVERMFEARNHFSPQVPPNARLMRARINHPMMVAQSADRNAAELYFEPIRDGDRVGNAYNVLAERFSETFDLRDMAYFLYRIPEAPSIELDILLLFKLIEDLPYRPKELLYLYDRILNNPAFEGQSVELRDNISAAHQAMLAAYGQHFPLGE
jgi:hypothetical protein